MSGQHRGAGRRVDPPAYAAENPHAGQGPVLLEIGADSGALVLSAPEGLVGREIEIRPWGHSRRAEAGLAPHAHQAPHQAGASTHHPHAAVVPRPLPDGGVQPCVVYPDVHPGVYTLRLLPDGPTMPVVVGAGRVTTADWEGLA